ncbi:MAG: hypothetical protein JKX84_02505 [Flavobacteriales bacterium]|nr:hypothetical protein [Flavobacteriales bacterium]
MRKSLVGLFCLVVLVLNVLTGCGGDPKKDAELAKQAFCNCETQNIQAILSEHQRFLDVFDKAGYTDRVSAWREFDQLHKAGKAEYEACNRRAGELETETRGKFRGSGENLEKYNQTFNAHKCVDNLSPKITVLSKKVQELILSIEEPLPDQNRVKADLVGKNYKWWSFRSLSDFKTFNDFTADDNGLFGGGCDVSVNVTLQRSGQPFSEAKLRLKYKNDRRNGWTLTSVSCTEIKQHIIAPVGNYAQIKKLSNNFRFDCNRRYWIKDGSYRAKKGGSDIGHVTVRNRNTYQVASREMDPVTIVFTFPNPKN